ncbi:MAG: transposase [Deltaproteobacteria bacterium]|nr:transposase [Deltaproteobacteria bacterium]
MADIFMAVEPMAGKRWVSVTERRTSVAWSLYIQDLLDNKYPDASKVVLVMGNLNTHAISSLYKTFPPDEALRLANRLELHCAPKRAGWLNMAEIELSVLAGQRLNRRVGDIGTMRREVTTWETARNRAGADVTWRFTTDDARIKLRRLYPKI